MNNRQTMPKDKNTNNDNKKYCTEILRLSNTAPTQKRGSRGSGNLGFLMNTKCIPDHTTNIPAKILLQMVP